jgi:hypothetical protein
MLRVRDGVPYADNPLVLVELAFKVGVSLFKAQVSALSGSPELIEELATKDQGEGFLVEEIGLFAWNPAFALCA